MTELNFSVRKNQLRQEMRQKRQEIAPQERLSLEHRMYLHLIGSRVYHDCDQLFCFVSLPQEPQTLWVLRHALTACEKCVAVPRCLPDHRMQFYRLNPDIDVLEQLKPGTYGVLEPSEDLPVVTPNPEQKTLCLVPGLAFDRSGGRLGYGAGYYDRFFAAHPQMLKIGYTTSQFVIEEVPMEPTDQRLDGVATEYPLEVWNG